MTNKELLKKADLALSDLSANGGLLSTEQNNTFIRTLIDSPTILNVARVVTMNSPTMKINKIGFGSRIMRPALESGGALDAGGNSRWMLAADRAKPTTSQISLVSKEVIAEVHLPYEILEDNIEGGNPATSPGSSAGGLMDTLLTLIGQRAALDFEELALLADSASGDSYLALTDGFLKRATSHVVDAAGSTINKNVVKAGYKAMPDKYLRNRSALKNFVSVDNEIEFRDTYASRNTSLGDSVLQGTGPVYAFGSEVTGVPLMPNSKGLLCDPLNLIFGIQRKVMMEYDKDIRARLYIIVLTARVDVQIEEADAVVKYINIG